MKRNIYLIMLFLSLAGFRNSGTRTIHGTVYDKADGSRLPGVNVFLPGLPRIGTVTDKKGRYAITLQEGKTELRFNYVGYDTQTVKIGKSDTLLVYLNPTIITPDMIPVGPY
jgi:Ca-activated chloride channel family protein